MSATMARQGGQVHLEQSNLRLASNMAKLAKERFLPAAREETQYKIMNPRAKFREGKKRGVQFPWHGMVKAATERYLLMVRENHTDGCLPCQNGTA